MHNVGIYWFGWVNAFLTFKDELLTCISILFSQTFMLAVKALKNGSSLDSDNPF